MLKLVALALGAIPMSAQAFCGFYVAKADASLYNKASQVVYVRDGNKNALTLFNDFKGEPSEFALVVPVPEVLTREQINVGERAVLEHLDTYSAPRLVEYFDHDPCAPVFEGRGGVGGGGPAKGKAEGGAERAKSLGVTIEAQYTVGEYDIVILGAKESKGLESWLKENGYKMPSGASRALEPYIKQGLKFFVAKVNLKEQAKSGFTFLRPIQFAFESPKFMLPIRLGMVNSDGPQDLIVYAITRTGRVETTNYRTVKLPSGMDVPLYVKSKFADFYRAMFDTQYEKENKKVLFQEYAWNMSWCDPCAADPLSADELRKLGVFWQDEIPPQQYRRGLGPRPFFPVQQPPQAYITRLHVRYDRSHFPEDLMFQVTSDSENYQGRYVLRHPFTGNPSCPAMESYKAELKTRRQKEAEQLATLTGWKMDDIRKEMSAEAPGNPVESKEGGPDKKWYKNIFK